MPSRRNLKWRVWMLRLWDGVSVNKQFLNDDVRRQLILFNVARIDYHQSSAGRKPESPIGSFAPRRLHSTGAFNGWKAFAFPIREAIHPVGPSIGASV